MENMKEVKTPMYLKVGNGIRTIEVSQDDIPKFTNNGYSLTKPDMDTGINTEGVTNARGINVEFTKFEYALLKELSKKQNCSPANFIHRATLNRMLELQDTEVKA